MKKLLQKRGETLVESLVSILLVTFIMLFLSTAIVASARINKRLRDTDISYKVAEETDRPASASTLTISKANADGSASTTDPTISAPISVYQSENGYEYYRFPSKGGRTQ